MHKLNGRSPLRILGTLMFLVAGAAAIAAQSSAQTKPADADNNVIRVKAELVQTDLTVVDKRGQFVGGLNEKGWLLTVAMQLDSEMVNFDSSDHGIVDVLGTALDDRGLFASFKQRLEVPQQAVLGANRYIKWTQVLTLAPGLYQVRVAVRDRGNARTGSAMMWIEIPEPVER
jgi:hypothetical protein